MKKNIAYFPGCIQSKNKNLEKVFRRLGLNVELVSEWNCCGTPPAYNKPSFFNKVVMPLRNLGISQRNGYDFLYSDCQVCVRQVNEAIKIINSDSMFKKQADYSLKPFNAILKNTKTDSAGAIHLIDILVDSEIKEIFLNNASRSLKGHSILLYTGCYENISKINILKEILILLGAKVNLYQSCCGGEKLQNNTPIQSKRVENANAVDVFFRLINEKADENNSDYIVAICSMCEKNIMDGIELSELDTFAPIIGLAEFVGFLFGMENFGNMINLIINNAKAEFCV